MSDLGEPCTAEKGCTFPNRICGHPNCERGRAQRPKPLVEFRKEHYSLVAKIQEDQCQAVEVVALGDGNFDLTIHRLNEELNMWEDMTVTLKPEHFAALGAVPQASDCSPVTKECGAKGVAYVDPTET